MAVKDIENGDNLLEIETNERFDTVDKLIQEKKNSLNTVLIHLQLTEKLVGRSYHIC